MLACTSETDLQRMGGLIRDAGHGWTFVAARSALAVVFPLAGFFAKDQILEVANHTGRTWIYLLGTLGALLSALYIGRLVFLAFFGSPRSEEAEHAHESPPVMTAPLLVLAAGAVLAGLLLSTSAEGPGAVSSRSRPAARRGAVDPRLSGSDRDRAGALASPVGLSSGRSMAPSASGSARPAGARSAWYAKSLPRVREPGRRRPVPAKVFDRGLDGLVNGVAPDAPLAAVVASSRRLVAHTRSPSSSRRLRLVWVGDTPVNKCSRSRRSPADRRAADDRRDSG